MRVVVIFAVGSVFLILLVSITTLYFSKSIDQITVEYGLDPEQVALYVACNKATSESMARFPPKLDSVDGCACLVSRVSKKNYSVYFDIFNSMDRKPAAAAHQTRQFRKDHAKTAVPDGDSVLAEIKAFTDFAANAEYCVRLN